ncbi:hypothetical protein [Amycolatopsis sp.]|uniref:hypothetical protein n=1 Tax=Amycolatopsis sp. TaxID=37632 RepID=UPI002CA0FD5C|nr:hypothetical protein [Amycolatopsis sp.]HVV11457.1 hypothetical protein [Amycolatopsis sp.]
MGDRADRRDRRVSVDLRPAAVDPVCLSGARTVLVLVSTGTVGVTSGAVVPWPTAGQDVSGGTDSRPGDPDFGRRGANPGR